MRVTCWTSYEKAQNKYIEPSLERLNLMNKDKRFITPKELDKLAEEQNISREDAYFKWKTEYDKIPMFVDEKKAHELMQIYKEMEQTVIEHCKEKESDLVVIIIKEGITVFLLLTTNIISCVLCENGVM